MGGRDVFVVWEKAQVIIVAILKKIEHKRKLKKAKPYVELSEESFYNDGFRIDLRNPQKSKVYLSVGKHCVLSGNYIFETNNGKISIGNRVHIGGSTFISINGIEIGDDVTIAWGCLVYDHNSHSTEWEERKNDTEREYQDLLAGNSPIESKDWSSVKSAPIKICDKVWIGAGCKILKGVTIGEGAIIGAGSVVTCDIEPWTMVGGNPAKLIRHLRK